MEAVTLNGGVEMPALGLWVFQTPPPDETRDAVRAVLDAGYRHIDTAAAHGNERQVSEAVHASDLDRPEIFLEARSGSATTDTTKHCTASRRAPASSASTRSTR